MIRKKLANAPINPPRGNDFPVMVRFHSRPFSHSHILTFSHSHILNSNSEETSMHANFKKVIPPQRSFRISVFEGYDTTSTILGGTTSISLFVIEDGRSTDDSRQEVFINKEEAMKAVRLLSHLLKMVGYSD